MAQTSATIRASLSLLSANDCRDYLSHALCESLQLQASFSAALRGQRAAQALETRRLQARLASAAVSAARLASARDASLRDLRAVTEGLEEAKRSGAEDLRKAEMSRNRQVATAREQSLRARAHAASLESRLQSVTADYAASVAEVKRLERDLIAKA